MKKRISAAALLLLMVIALLAPVASAAEASYATWNEVADAMEEVLDNSYEIYITGDYEGARDEVNHAYYSFYEAIGYERVVMASISGARGVEVESQFKECRKIMLKQVSNEEVREALDTLIRFLHEDADILDGVSPDGEAGAGSTRSAGVSSFMTSFFIMLREGLEAILIVGAIIAYLVKSGNKDKTRSVYIGSILALAASVAMAMILNAVMAANTASQEIIEGVTMLIAVAVLIYVSNWMVSKSESEIWSRYIQSKVQGSISKGSLYTLAFTAFLAVFREGAEVILFYQALIVAPGTDTRMMWTGFGVGCVVLVGVYLAIRLLSIRLPLKPFFLGTSWLMALMAVSFIGGAVYELQEADIFGATVIPGFPTIEVFGIYPRVETLVPQLILLVITIITFVIQMRRNKVKRLALMAEHEAELAAETAAVETPIVPTAENTPSQED